MRAGESFLYHQAALPQGPFTLSGGKYWVTAVASNWNGGTVALQRVAADGVTQITVGTNASFTADGGAVLDLPPGTYNWDQTSVSASLGVSTEVVRIPEE